MRFMEIDPQPARGKLDESMWDSPDWLAEEKYDGERRIAQFCGSVVRFTGRRSRTTNKVVEKTAQLPHLSGDSAVPLDGDHRIISPPRTLDGTVLDGELILPAGYVSFCDGGKSKAVTSIANSLPAEAIRKQIQRGWLRYVVFDCLFWEGSDVRDRPLEERKRYAACAVNTWANPFVPLAPVLCSTLKRTTYEQIIERGGEGVILKRLDHRYGDEKGWVKVKKISTADVVIIGFKAAKETSKKVDGTISKTKYAGKVGSVEIGQYRPYRGLKEKDPVIPVGFARGFSDRLMDEFTRHPKKYLGKVITIEANDREPTGKFRHPRVIHPDDPFRADKDPKSCVFDLNER